MTQTPELPDEARPSEPTPQPGPVNLSPRMTSFMSVVITCLFVVNIIADIFVKGYSGYPQTALLGILIGSILGFERFIRIGR